MAEVPWPQRVQTGVCGFPLRMVGLWLGEELMGGDATSAHFLSGATSDIFNK